MKNVLLSTFLVVLFSGCLTLEPQKLTLNQRTAEDYQALAVLERAEGSVMQSFNAHKKYWFGCGDVEVELVNGALKAEFVEQRFSCIGGKPLISDLSDKPVIVMRIKAESKTFTEPMTIKFRMEDMNGYETNYDEQVYTFEMNQDYVDFELDFTDRIVAVNGNLDDQNIVKVKAFFNVNGSKPFTGTVWIDEIRAKPTKIK